MSSLSTASFYPRPPPPQTTINSDLHSDPALPTTVRTVSTCLKIACEVICQSVSSCLLKKIHLRITLTGFLFLGALRNKFSARLSLLCSQLWTGRMCASLHMDKLDLAKLTRWRDPTASYSSTNRWSCTN